MESQSPRIERPLVRIALMMAPPLLAWVCTVGGLGQWPWLMKLPGFWVPLVAQAFSGFFGPVVVAGLAMDLIGDRLFPNARLSKLLFGYAEFTLVLLAVGMAFVWMGAFR